MASVGPHTGAGADREPSSGWRSEPPGHCGPVMSEEDRRHLWDIEHWVFTIDHDILSNAARAMTMEDASLFRKLLAEDFEGSVVELSAEPTIQHPVKAWSVHRKNAEPHSTTADGITDFLLSLRRKFTRWSASESPPERRFFVPRPEGKPGEPPRVQFAITRLSPQDRGRHDGPWKGGMKIRLTGSLADGGVGEIILKANIQLDRPNDDLPKRSGWLRRIDVQEVSFVRSDRFLFEDVTRQAGLNPERLQDNWTTDGTMRATTGGVYLGDLNNDDWIDCLVTDRLGTFLYLGSSGGFQDGTNQRGIPSATARGVADPACIADFDNDGWDDVIVGDQIFRNLGEGRLALVSSNLSPRLASQPFVGYVVADFDQDGRLDLYATDATPRLNQKMSWIDDRSAGPNRLYRNDGNWRFTDVTDTTASSAGARSSFTANWLDADDDGRPDLAIPDEFGSQILLRNTGTGSFAEVPMHESHGGFAMGMSAGDLDNDGRVDLYTATMYSKAADRIISNVPDDAFPAKIMDRIRNFALGNDWFHNDGESKFSRRAQAAGVASAGWAYGPTLADFDGNGWLDIYVPCGFQSISYDEADG